MQCKCGVERKKKTKKGVAPPKDMQIKCDNTSWLAIKLRLHCLKLPNLPFNRPQRYLIQSVRYPKRDDSPNKRCKYLGYTFSDMI